MIGGTKTRPGMMKTNGLMMKTKADIVPIRLARCAPRAQSTWDGRSATPNTDVDCRYQDHPGRARIAVIGYRFVTCTICRGRRATTHRKNTRVETQTRYSPNRMTRLIITLLQDLTGRPSSGPRSASSIPSPSKQYRARKPFPPPLSFTPPPSTSTVVAAVAEVIGRHNTTPKRLMHRLLKGPYLW